MTLLNFPVKDINTESSNQIKLLLRHQVEQAMRNYFTQLGDVLPVSIYEGILAEFELSLLKMVLAKTQGNQSKAAEILGISRGSLLKKLKKYGLNKRSYHYDLFLIERRIKSNTRESPGRI